MAVKSLAPGLRGCCAPSSVSQASCLLPLWGPSPAPQPSGVRSLPPALPAQADLAARGGSVCARSSVGRRTETWGQASRVRLPRAGRGPRFLPSLVLTALKLEAGVGLGWGAGTALAWVCATGENFLDPGGSGAESASSWGLLPVSGVCAAVRSSRRWGSCLGSKSAPSP